MGVEEEALETVEEKERRENIRLVDNVTTMTMTIIITTITTTTIITTIIIIIIIVVIYVFVTVLICTGCQYNPTVKVTNY